MSKKPAKFRIKFSMVSEAARDKKMPRPTLYYEHFFILAKKKEMGVEEQMTWSLMEPYKDTGLNETASSLFTRLSFARKLLHSNITVVGTMRAH